MINEVVQLEKLNGRIFVLEQCRYVEFTAAAANSKT